LIAGSTTEFFAPDMDVQPVLGESEWRGAIELAQETTISALYRLTIREDAENTAALNFANAWTPGSG
jgi:hypothetical protein